MKKVKKAAVAITVKVSITLSIALSLALPTISLVKKPDPAIRPVVVVIVVPDHAKHKPAKAAPKHHRRCSCHIHNR